MFSKTSTSMSRVVFIITLVITLVCAEVVIDNHQLEAKLEFIKNIDDFKTNNPQLVLYPLDRVGMGKQGIRYTIGQRKSGDRLISTLAKDNYWGSLQDVSLTLTYPTSGYGYVVTYVQVNINQVTKV